MEGKILVYSLACSKQQLLNYAYCARMKRGTQPELLGLMLQPVMEDYNNVFLVPVLASLYVCLGLLIMS